MPSYPQQFLYTIDGLGCPTELINGARTLTNIRNSNNPSYSNLKVDAGCPSLLLEPSTTTFTLPSTVTTTSWGALNTAITAAPWYVATVPASAEGFGFLITEWSGLDGEHHGRTSLAGSSGRGGSYFGPLTEKGRVWKLNVRVCGSTERGLNYLMHWLEGQLLGCCSGEGSGSVWIREHCPASAAADPEEGMARADRVALLEGPTWEDSPIPDLSCILRTLSFTLGVGDPCLYRPASAFEVTLANSVLSDGVTMATSVYPNQGDGPGIYGTDSYVQAPCNRFTTTNMSECIVLPRATVGRMSAVVTISSPAEAVLGTLKQVPDIRIIGHVDRAGVGTCTPCTNTQKSLMILRGILAGDIIEVDLGRRKVRRKGSWAGGEWDDASYLMVQTFPLRPWAAFDPCDAGAVTVEPASLDQFVNITNLVSTYTINIKAQEHFGCRC